MTLNSVLCKNGIDLKEKTNAEIGIIFSKMSFVPEVYAELEMICLFEQ